MFCPMFVHSYAPKLANGFNLTLKLVIYQTRLVAGEIVHLYKVLETDFIYERASWIQDMSG